MYTVCKYMSVYMCITDSYICVLSGCLHMCTVWVPHTVHICMNLWYTYVYCLGAFEVGLPVSVAVCYTYTYICVSQIPCFAFYIHMCIALYIHMCIYVCICDTHFFFWWVLQHCTGFARLVWGRLRVHRAFIYSNWFVCSVCFCSLLPRLTLLLSFLDICTASPARWECL